MARENGGATVTLVALEQLHHLFDAPRIQRVEGFVQYPELDPSAGQGGQCDAPALAGGQQPARQVGSIRQTDARQRFLR